MPAPNIVQVKNPLAIAPDQPDPERKPCPNWGATVTAEGTRDQIAASLVRIADAIRHGTLSAKWDHPASGAGELIVTPPDEPAK